MAANTKKVDGKKLEAFVGKMLGDVGGALTCALAYVGEKAGLWKALAGGPATAAELAKKTGTAERYVREWAAHMAAGGYLEYQADGARFRLPPEQAACLVDADSPTYFQGAFESLTAVTKAEGKLLEAFRTGKGIGWGEHDARLFSGTEKFFRSGYHAHLAGEWIPALEGVAKKLEAGGKMADIGCGFGASSIEVAKAFPKSEIHGFDAHGPSIEAARGRAREAGVGDRVRFETATAKDFKGGGFDLVAFFDCLHDMGDPVGAARHALKALKPDGTVLLVEPFAGDRVEENLHPIGRVFYGFSTMVCTPASLSQEIGLALGAQAGEARLKAVFTEAGFKRFRRAAQTPFNLILEARP